MPNPRRPAARSIFLNCPFDEQYKAHFTALIFAVHDCGFYARCALEISDSGQSGFQKICQLIRECRCGIHDLSRTSLDPITHLPRFNMPLELGLFLGARVFASRRRPSSKVCLVMQYRYRDFCPTSQVSISKDTMGNPCRSSVWCVTGSEPTKLNRKIFPVELIFSTATNSSWKNCPNFADLIIWIRTPSFFPSTFHWSKLGFWNTIGMR